MTQNNFFLVFMSSSVWSGKVNNFDNIPNIYNIFFPNEIMLLKILNSSKHKMTGQQHFMPNVHNACVCLW